MILFAFALVLSLNADDQHRKDPFCIHSSEKFCLIKFSSTLIQLNRMLDHKVHSGKYTRNANGDFQS